MLREMLSTQNKATLEAMDKLANTIVTKIDEITKEKNTEEPVARQQPIPIPPSESTLIQELDNIDANTQKERMIKLRTHKKHTRS